MASRSTDMGGINDDPESSSSPLPPIPSLTPLQLRIHAPNDGYDDRVGSSAAGTEYDGFTDDKRRDYFEDASARAALSAVGSTDRLRPASVAYNTPGEYGNLDEVVADPLGPSSRGSAISNDRTLEEVRRSQGQDGRSDDVEMQELQSPMPEADGAAETSSKPVKQVSRLATQLYTLSYLVFFAIWGTLARLGLQALTTYPGAPVSFPVLWANVGGSFIMGFLAEDRKLFLHEWGAATYDEQLRKARQQQEQQQQSSDASGGSGSGSGSASAEPVIDLAAAKKAHLATKKTIPLYIGLATGFCGSFTSFSSFMRDVFLAMSNDLPGADNLAPVTRNGGYSFLAMMAVIIATVGLSIAALYVGAHFAIALEPLTPSVPYPLGRNLTDYIAVLLGWGCWLGAVLLAIWPPHDAWRGQAVFALVFAPLGCLGRFYVSMWLNARIPAFPLGTFAVNVAGVAIIGMCWTLGHRDYGGVVGCQVLQGVDDGFCGCLTTVSTWVSELTSLRRRHAYTYGTASVVVGFSALVVIMGAVRWSDGFEPLKCSH